MHNSLLPIRYWAKSKYQPGLVQKEKTSVLGNLVAGVAHEINNPWGFIVGNLQPAIDHIQDLIPIIDLFCKRITNTKNY